MRILSTVFFLSFLAGKFATFEQKLLTEQIFKKMVHAYFRRPYFSRKFFGGKLKISKQPLKILLNFQF